MENLPEFQRFIFAKTILNIFKIISNNSNKI